jgi:Fe-S-cluster containining protein
MAGRSLKRIGICDQCKRPGIEPAQCCRAITVWWPPDDSDYECWLMAHEGVSRQGGWVTFALRCRWLTAEGDCSIYEDRPQLCRDWPAEPDDLELVPACAYRFEEDSMIQEQAS